MHKCCEHTVLYCVLCAWLVAFLELRPRLEGCPQEPGTVEVGMCVVRYASIRHVKRGSDPGMLKLARH